MTQVQTATGSTAQIPQRFLNRKSELIAELEQKSESVSQAVIDYNESPHGEKDWSDIAAAVADYNETVAEGDTLLSEVANWLTDKEDKNDESTAGYFDALTDMELEEPENGYTIDIPDCDALDELKALPDTYIAAESEPQTSNAELTPAEYSSTFVDDEEEEEEDEDDEDEDTDENEGFEA